MPTFGDFIIELLDKLGVFRLFLPFILIWAISYIVIYASLKKINIGNASSLASLLSFVLALLSVYYLASVLFIQYFVPIITLIVLVLVIGFATFFFMVPEKEQNQQSILENLVRHRGFQAVIVILIFVAALVSLSFTISNPLVSPSVTNQTPTQTQVTSPTQPSMLPFNYITSPVVLGALFLLAIATLLVYISEMKVQNNQGNS